MGMRDEPGGIAGSNESEGTHQRDSIRRLLRDIAASGRDPTAAEIERIREHVAGVGFDPTAQTPVSRRLIGLSWQGHTFRAGERASTELVHFLRHREEWPVGTTLAEYRQSLADTVRNPGGGIRLEQIAGQWRITFIAPSGAWRGPLGGAWIFVGYTIDFGYWTTGFQPRQSLERTLAERQGIEQARWLQRPS